jgi:hypothetical protein
MSCRFQDAYRMARDRYSDDMWHDLSARTQSAAIYRAMRRLDAAAAASVQEQVPVLANHRRAKVTVRGAANHAEADLAINAACGD